MRLMLKNGELEVTMNALKKLVYLAVLESYGPVGLEPEGVLNRFFGKTEGKGIRVEERDDATVVVDLFIDLEFGMRIPEVARNIMENVTHKLKTLAGCEKVEVNVHITGVK